MPYIDSAGVKLNKNADIIIEADASGSVTSCRDAVTGTEYAGGGDIKSINVTLSVTDTVVVKNIYTYNDGEINIDSAPITSGNIIEYNTPIFGGQYFIIQMTPGNYNLSSAVNAEMYLSSKITNSLYQYVYKITDINKPVQINVAS